MLNSQRSSSTTIRFRLSKLRADSGTARCASNVHTVERLSDSEIKLVRKVGDFGSQEATATRDSADSEDEPEPVRSSAGVEVRIDRVIKDAFKDSFRIGTAGDFPTRYSDQELEVAAEHFNAVTPENCMKPERIHPEEDQWRFERPDALVEWATDNKMSIHGHTLVWHAQTRDWFFRDGDKETITQRMKDHIHTLVGRYKGKIRSWDVVNEAINDGGNEETGEDREPSRFQMAANARPGVPDAGVQVRPRSGSRRDSLLQRLQHRIGTEACQFDGAAEATAQGRCTDSRRRHSGALAKRDAFRLKTSTRRLPTTRRWD